MHCECKCTAQCRTIRSNTAVLCLCPVLLHIWLLAHYDVKVKKTLQLFEHHALACVEKHSLPVILSGWSDQSTDPVIRHQTLMSEVISRYNDKASMRLKSARRNQAQGCKMHAFISGVIFLFPSFLQACDVITHLHAPVKDSGFTPWAGPFKRLAQMFSTDLLISSPLCQPILYILVVFAIRR